MPRPMGEKKFLACWNYLREGATVQQTSIRFGLSLACVGRIQRGDHPLYTKLQLGLPHPPSDKHETMPRVERMFTPQDTPHRCPTCGRMMQLLTLAGAGIEQHTAVCLECYLEWERELLGG